MKHFLFKASVFSLSAVALLLGTICGLLHLRMPAIRDIFRAVPDTHVVVLGDSHAMNAFDETLFERTQNFSTDSLHPWQVLMRLRCILEQDTGRRIKDVVLTVSSHWTYKTVFRESARTQFTGILPLAWQYRGDWPYDEFPVDIMYLLDRFLDILNPKRAQYIGQPYGVAVSLFLTKPEAPFVKAVIERHYPEDYDVSRDVDGDERLRKTYRDTIELCRNHGARLTFVITPVHEMYRAGVPNDAPQRLRMYAQWLRNQGMRCLDYWEWPLESSDFYDADHLNDNGRRKFAAEMSRVLGIPLRKSR